VAAEHEPAVTPALPRSTALPSSSIFRRDVNERVQEYLAAQPKPSAAANSAPPASPQTIPATVLTVPAGRDGRFELMVEQMPFSVQILDPAGRTVRVNRAWEKLWGITLDALADYNLLQDQQLVEKGVMPFIKRAFAGETVEIPPIAYAPDRGEFHGQERWTRAIIYPVLNEDGTLCEVILMHEDITRRTEAERALRQSEARFRTIFEHAASGIALADSQGRFVECNAAFSAIVGYTEAELREIPFASLIHPEDRPDNLAQAQQLLRAERPFFTIENRYVRKDGEPVWVQKFVSLLPNELGEQAHLVAIVTDITERRENVARLDYQKRLLEALTESVLDGIMIVSPDGRVIQANKRFQEIWNFPPEVIAAGSDEAALTWAAGQTADPAGFLARVAAVYAEPDKPVREELLMKDGRVYDRFGSPIRSGDVRLGWVWTFRDISERKRAESALREKEAFVRLLLDSAADAFYGVDCEGVTTFCNAAFLRMLGFTREEEVIGRKLHNVIHHSYPDGQPYPVEKCPLYLSAQTGERLHAADEVFFRVDGSSFPVEYWSHPIYRDGELTGAVTTFIDITERRQSELALQKAKREAEEANEAKDRFLAMLSHELRTPLTPVLMTLDALRDDPSLTDELRDDLELIHRNVEIETLLINDLLDITRITHGKMELRHDAVDVHKAIEQALGISAAELQRKEFVVVKEFAAPEHHCWADAARLQQVFWNIIINAVKFSANGGTLRISTRNDSEHRIRIDLTDTGIGIAPELQPRIFEAFEQGDRSGQHGGLGLGLAVAKRIVDMHGGEISVHSAGHDRGTTFSITLQAMQTSLLDGAAKPIERPRVAATSLAILLAEDHADTARLLQRLLQRAGHQVAHANSVAAALTLAAGARFDLLITDIGLPDGSGLALLAELRKHGDMPAIAISGFGMKADLDASRAAGFAEHFTKPLEWHRLQETIARLAGEMSAKQNFTA
jgi:PAS domain S-box-containing protein